MSEIEPVKSKEAGQPTCKVTVAGRLIRCRTSITVKVTVEAERWGAGRGERVLVTQAEVVLVAVDDQGRPKLIRS